MKKISFAILLILLIMSIAACGPGQNTATQSLVAAEPSSASSETEQSESNLKIQITVGDTILTATPKNNPSAEAFLALLQEQPVMVKMSDYAGMEKVGSLGTSLTTSDSQISVGAGDIILYQGNQITIYYGNNSWNFTKLAHIDDATKENLLEILGAEDVEVIFSLPQ